MSIEEDESWFEQGRRNAREYYGAQAFSGLTRYIEPEVAIRLFLPPEKEELLQIVRPISKHRQKWLAGFRKEQTTILAEMVVERRKENLLKMKDEEKE